MTKTRRGNKLRGGADFTHLIQVSREHHQGIPGAADADGRGRAAAVQSNEETFNGFGNTGFQSNLVMTAEPPIVVQKTPEDEELIDAKYNDLLNIKQNLLDDANIDIYYDKAQPLIFDNTIIDNSSGGVQELRNRVSVLNIKHSNSEEITNKNKKKKEFIAYIYYVFKELLTYVKTELHYNIQDEIVFGKLLNDILKAIFKIINTNRLYITLIKRNIDKPLFLSTVLNLNMFNEYLKSIFLNKIILYAPEEV